MQYQAAKEIRSIVSTRIKRTGRENKVELDNMTQTNITAPFTTADSAGPKHLDLEVTREKLESSVDSLITTTAGPCEECLQESDVSKSDITDVILAGGMARVQQTVKKIFGRSPSKSAAIEGCVLKGNLRGFILVGVTRLIEKNTKIPTKISEVFSTESDNQTQVKITCRY